MDSEASTPSRDQVNGDDACIGGQPKRVLQGVVAYVEVRSGNENRSKAISKELHLLGATIEEKFTKDVTHVVFREGRQGTVDKARKRNVHLVNVLWVDSCKRNQQHVSEQLYPALHKEENALTPVSVARLKKSKSMQPRDFDEEMSHSAERLAAKQRRKQKKERKPKYCVIDTPFQRARFFVEDTCPRSPDGSVMFSPSVVVPETPPSMKEKMDTLRRNKANKQGRTEYEESPLVAPSDDDVPLQRRLFDFTGASAFSSTDSEDPFASIPPFPSISSSSNSKSTPRTVTSPRSSVISVSPHSGSVQERIGAGDGWASASSSSAENTPIIYPSSPAVGNSGSVSVGCSPVVGPRRTRRSMSNALANDRRRSTPAASTRTDSSPSSAGSEASVVGNKATFKAKLRRSIPGDNASESKTKSVGKKKLLSLTSGVSPQLITPCEDVNTEASVLGEDVPARKKVVAKKRGKTNFPPTKDPSVLFSESKGAEKLKNNQVILSKKSKKRKTEDEDVGTHSNAVVKKRTKTDTDSEKLIITNNNSAQSKPTSRRKSTRIRTPVLEDIAEDSEPVIGNVETPPADVPPFSRRNSRRRSRMAASSPGEKQSERLSKSPETFRSREKNGPGSGGSPKTAACGERLEANTVDRDPEEPEGMADGGKRIDATSGRRKSGVVESGGSRRRSARFITTSSQSSFTHNALTSFVFDDSITDVSALNTQNDTLQPSIGTRIALENVNGQVASSTQPQPQYSVSAIDPNLDEESDVTGGVVQRAGRNSIELARTAGRNSTLLKNIINTPVSMLAEDVSENSSTALSNSGMSFSFTKSRRSIDEFARVDLSIKKKENLKKNRTGNQEKKLVEEKTDKRDKAKQDKRKWKKVAVQHSPRSPPKRSLVMTSLHFDEQDIVTSVVERLGGFHIVDRVEDGTTHVICGGPRRTLNVLNCIVRGRWLLSFSWVLESLEAGKWLPEDQYEVDDYFPAAKLNRLEVREKRHRANLFMSQGLIMVCDSSKPPREELVALLKLCGGKVTNEARKADLCVGSVVKNDVLTVSEQWILDSITSKKCLALSEYQLNSPSRPEREPSPDF